MLKEVTAVMDVFHTQERTMAVKFPTEAQVVMAVMFTSEQVLDCRICMSYEGLILRGTLENLVRARKIMVLMPKTFVSQCH
jgi:hypothetical protein